MQVLLVALFIAFPSTPFFVDRARDTRRWLLTLAALALLAGCAGSGGPTAPVIPPLTDVRTGAAAAEDLRAAATFLRDVHPAPYRFINADRFQELVDHEAQALAGLDAPDDLRVGRAFHRVLAPVGDFHIKVGLPLYGDASTSISLLPVLPKRAGEQVFVDAASESFPPGTQLKYIDGRDIAALYEDLAPLVIHDGENEVAELRELERNFTKYYHLAYGMNTAYEIGVVLPDETDVHVRVLEGLDRQASSQLRTTRRSAPVWGPQSTGTPLPFRVQSDASVGYLRVPTFGVSDQDAFLAKLDELFTGLGDEKTLVIDLRGNEGGLRNLGFPVLGRLIDRPYRQWRSMSARVKRVPDRHRDRLMFPFATDDLALTPRFREARIDGRYVREGDPLAEHMVPVAPVFDDRHLERIIVFVDGLTNSAANTFILTLVTHRDDVLVVGEEIGGECREHVGEFPLVYVTPNYGIHMLVSLIHIDHIEVPNCERGRGLRPDIEIRYDADAFLQARDPYLDTIPVMSQD